jgi:hypothetical protein
MPIITHYGRFWNRELTDWDKRGELMGKANGNRLNIWNLKGIYLLHDYALQTVYVGQAGRDGGCLGNRIWQHCSDKHWGSWHYYSWFALRTDGTEIPNATSSVLNEMEDLFIYLLDPKNNEKRGTKEGVEEVFQDFHQGEGVFSPFPIYRELENLKIRLAAIEKRTNSK